MPHFVVVVNDDNIDVLVGAVAGNQFPLRRPLVESAQSFSQSTYGGPIHVPLAALRQPALIPPLTSTAIAAPEGVTETAGRQI